jgi:purine-binding chemotaxis protein CheW
MTDQRDNAVRTPPDPEARGILRARARALARIPEAPAADAASLEVLEFRLVQERYAVEIRHVREVYPLKDLTPLPSIPPFMAGVVNLRGRILPVLDLKKFFDLPEEGLADLHHIILVGGNDLEVGLLADVIEGVHTIAADTLVATLAGVRGAYLRGVTAERLIVLDVARILADPKLIVDQDVQS